MARVVFIRFDNGGPEWALESMLLRLLVSAGGLLLASVLVPGIHIGDWQALVAGTAIFGIVNMLLRPVAMALSCCLIVATFGLFVLVVNALLLALTAWASGQLGLDFRVDGFWSAFFGALIISIFSVFASVFVRRPAARL